MQFNQAPAPRESSLCDAYDPTASYSVDDLCIHDNVLYKCIVPISGGEAWNSAHWTETNVVDEIKAVNSNIAKMPEFVKLERSNITQSAGNDYWSISFPAKTGYERRIGFVNISQDNIVYMRSSFTSSQVELHFKNMSSSSITFDVSCIGMYLPEGNS